MYINRKLFQILWVSVSQQRLLGSGRGDVQGDKDDVEYDVNIEDDDDADDDDDDDDDGDNDDDDGRLSHSKSVRELAETAIQS